MLLLAICLYLITRIDKKNNDRGFMITVPKLAHPEIFNSIGRFFNPGDFFGPSPMFAFSQFPLGITLKPVEIRQKSFIFLFLLFNTSTSYPKQAVIICSDLSRGYFAPIPPLFQKRGHLPRIAYSQNF